MAISIGHRSAVSIKAFAHDPIELASWQHGTWRRPRRLRRLILQYACAAAQTS